ncbi:MAG: hypothetical protein RBS91_01345 [Sulfurimonadaceae bacterium]|jgi:hypothetical protein|nr:hypothetical protein [Sulfurimonadaceae bacterium]
MKKFTLIAAIFSTIVMANSEIGWVDEQLELISSPRETPKAFLSADPFVFLEKNKTKKDPKTGSKGATGAVASTTPTEAKKPPKEVFILSAIINQKALINGEWYAQNDKISKYTISSVTKNSATLVSGKKELVLSTTQSGSINFKNK